MHYQGKLSRRSGPWQRSPRDSNPQRSKRSDFRFLGSAGFPVGHVEPHKLANLAGRTRQTTSRAHDMVSFIPTTILRLKKNNTQGYPEFQNFHDFLRGHQCWQAWHPITVRPALIQGNFDRDQSSQGENHVATSRCKLTIPMLRAFLLAFDPMRPKAQLGGRGARRTGSMAGLDGRPICPAAAARHMKATGSPSSDVCHDFDFDLDRPT